MGKQFDGRCLDEVLRAFVQLADLVGAFGEPLAEEGVHSDAENEVATNGVEIELARMGAELLCDTVEGRVGACQDHRDPAVEPATGEGRLDRTAASMVIVSVGHDHRAFADDESDPDHVELVTPTKRFGGHQEHLVEEAWIADHNDSGRAEP